MADVMRAGALGEGAGAGAPLAGGITFSVTVATAESTPFAVALYLRVVTPGCPTGAQSTNEAGSIALSTPNSGARTIASVNGSWSGSVHASWTRSDASD